MPRSSGTYTAPSNSFNPAVEGTAIDETDWNATLDDIETAITDSVYTGGLGSSDNRLVRTDGTDTKKVQGTGIAVDDSNNLSGVVNQTMTGYIDVAEISAPSNPAANYARIYSADNAGVTELYYKRPDGTVVGLSPGATDVTAASNYGTDNVLIRSDGTGKGTQATGIVVDDSNNVTLPGSLALTGIISPSQITADQNDYAPAGFANAAVLRLTSDASRNITGLAGGASGLIRLLENVGAQNIVLKDESASSTAANRFALSADVTLAPDNATLIKYDATSSRWRVIGGAGSSDVTAASSFGTDNVIVRSDGTAKGVQATGLSVDDSNNLTGLPSVNSGPLAGHRNRLINGSMQIWQRNTASVGDDTYGLDRWNNLAQTAATTLSQLTDVENTTHYMMRITQGQASAQRFGTAQIIEAINCKDLRGQPITLSARVRCSNSTTLRYAILEWTGTADSVTSDVVSDWTSGTFTAGNFFLGSNLTVTATGSTALTANTLTSVSLSTTLGSSLNNLIVMFWTDSTQAQNSTLDLGKVQLEPGATATVFERRPHSLEISLAQRYYQRLWGETSTDFLLQAVATAGSQAIAATYTFGTKMRIAPTGTVVGSFNLVNSTALQIVATFTNGFSVNNGATTGSGSVQINSTGTSTYITFDAEL